ncbi:MAG: iron-sulfur cluster assembly scaffold protein [Patescibacteria group bacterium]
MNDKYSQKAMDHFLSPKNMGVIEDADGVGEVGNPRCGDLMTVYIKVKDEKIADMKFKTLGCAAAIATSDMVCEVAKGKTVDEALKITFQDILDELGSLPAPKIHCADLAQKGLKAAVEDHRGGNKEG